MSSERDELRRPVEGLPDEEVPAVLAEAPSAPVKHAQLGPTEPLIESGFVTWSRGHDQSAITAQLTMAESNPVMAGLRPLAADSWPPPNAGSTSCGEVESRVTRLADIAV